MELSKKERKNLISRISKASGVAQYALEEKMTDEQVIEAANNLKIFLLIKSANDYNRYCQGQKTADANAKLKQFINIQNSEIYQAGQWLINALSRNGQDRKQTLLEKDLVDKNDYNLAVSDLKDTIAAQKQDIQRVISESKIKINNLENAVDSLRDQLIFIQDYITNNYGLNNWNEITKYIQKNINKGSRHETS
jgi:hypothetical protein